ncbi:MAG TPA: hypothetical protein VM915_00195, partial [Verrucomicrobiae bacterium]|nr:hypothetical protein [Verrucomicrobiae bacterium]
MHRDWETVPKLCKPCKSRNAANWYEIRCGCCGVSVKAHKDWDKPPKYCSRCKEREAEQWYEVACAHCGDMVRARHDWEHPPKYCKKCKERFPATVVNCKDCGAGINVSTGQQLKCAANGWSLPERCDQCKRDTLLIKGAIGAARDQFGFAVDVEIEQRGLIFTDKVAIVRNRKTGEKIAEIQMDEKGLIFTERVAVTKETKTGKKLAETRDEQKGLIFTQRAARTYSKES